MDLIIWILCILLVLSICEAFTKKQKQLNKLFYPIAFFLTFFLFTIKYYYGADFISYNNLYSNLPTISELANGGHISTNYEPGFVYFCVLMKSLGLSFWGMTAVVSIIYFYAIYKLFKLIPSNKTLALLLLVTLDYNLIFATHRQCLAVSAFILGYLAFEQKKYIPYIILMIITAITHKSGLLFCVIGLLIPFVRTLTVSNRSYLFLFVPFILFMILPIDVIAKSICNILPIGQVSYESITYHLSFCKRIQSIAFLYITFFSILILYKNTDSIYSDMSIIILSGCLMIAVFYQTFPILWRLRSYFLPFAIVYSFSTIHNSNSESVKYSKHIGNYNLLIKQCLVLLIIVFCSYYTYSYKKLHGSLKSKIYETCTIFDLLHRNQKEILQDRESRAVYYWKNENLD